MTTLYLFDPRHPSPSPVNLPTTLIRSEAFYHASKAVLRGRAYELWENGLCIQAGGPATEFACPIRPRRR